ncbi:MAG TPA: peptide ABC transporter substrate-binding protein [Ktedonobacterales bacterium]|jgi:peptide/nickel transport system substrate-binding protein/oligopeptide transport system substrate-binding protein
MRRFRGVFVVAGLLCAVSLAGCGLPWPFPQPTPDPRLPDAQQVFRPLESGPNAGDVDTFDPAQIQFGFDYGVAQLIFPQLVTLDEKQQPMDWAAESHTISADGLTYTFHLHKGMAWADGTPIDATIFAYSINRTLDPCTATYTATHLFDLAGAEAFNNGACPAGAIKSAATLIGTAIQTPDPLTLRLTLAHPAGYFLSALTYPTSWAVPQALVEKYTTPVHYSSNDSNGTDSTWTEHLLDNGPFGGNLYLLTTWQHPNSTADGRGHLVFERNERFSGKKPLLRRIEYTLYRAADLRTEWQDFTRGAGDSASIYSDALTIAQARTLAGVVLQQVPSLGFSFLAINWKYAPFDDVRVRQAFSLALDRQAIEHEMFLDTSQPTIHLAPEGMPGYNPDLTDAAGRKGKDALTPDIPAAQALLKSYAADKCRGQLVLCPPIYLSVPNGSTRFLQLGKMLQQQWQQAFPGWSISLQTLGGDIELSRPRHLQLWWDGWGADYPDPHDFLSVLWATQAEYNYSAVSMPQVDALLSQADGMSDQAARISLYQLAEQLLVNQGAAIPLTQNVYWYAVRSRVVGWQVAPTDVTPLSVWQTAYLKR